MINLSGFNFYGYLVFMLFIGQLAFDSALCADYSQVDDAAKINVLLIGRPERGGVNIEKAKENFPEIAHSDVFYVAPNSEGNRSIREHFPCDIPSDKPSSFTLVCLEQGMLNEVASSFLQQSQEQNPQPLLFTGAHKQELAELMRKRKELYEDWARMKHKIRQLEKIIIKEALDKRLIKETRRSTRAITYEIVGLSGVFFETQDESINFCEDIYMVKIFDNKERILAENETAFEHIGPLEEEVRQLIGDLDTRKKDLGNLDELINPLVKLEYKECELRKQQQSESPSLQTRLEESSEQRFNAIQKFIIKAWELVNPNGQMIVFSGDAPIMGTALAQGISKNFLKSILQDFTIEERPFCSQSREGKIYFSNPAIPANQDTFNWEGPRRAGSYFLIKRLK